VEIGRSKRERFLALVTGLLIVAVVLALVIIEPQLKRRKARLVRVHELELQLMKMRQDVLLKNRIDLAYKQIEPLVAGTRSEQQEISAFTRELGDLYSRLAVKTRSVKLLPTVREPFYCQLSVRIEMQGHIRELLKFVHAVETHGTPIRINELVLRAQEAADQVDGSLLITKVVTDVSK